jgi:hypothetical protein
MKNYLFALVFTFSFLGLNAQNVTLFDSITPIHVDLTYKKVVKLIGEPDSTLKSTWNGKKVTFIKSYYNSLSLEIKYHNYKYRSKFKKQLIKEIHIYKNSSLKINNLPITGLTEEKLINVFGGQKERTFDTENSFYHYTYLQKNAHFDVDFYFDSKGELDEIYIRFGRNK